MAKKHWGQNFKNIFPFVAFGCVVGATVGIGLYTFIYAKGYSYLSDNPAVCANCHVMQNQLDSWVKSTHHDVATCNSCHMPHNLPKKIYTKTRNGFWHSFYFTTGNFPEPIQITRFNLDVVEGNCRSCHEDIVSAMDGPHQPDQKLSCISCHGSVGHPK